MGKAIIGIILGVLITPVVFCYVGMFLDNLIHDIYKKFAKPEPESRCSGGFVNLNGRWGPLTGAVLGILIGLISGPVFGFLLGQAL